MHFWLPFGTYQTETKVSMCVGTHQLRYRAIARGIGLPAATHKRPRLSRDFQRLDLLGSFFKYYKNRGTELKVKIRKYFLFSFPG